MIKFEDYKEEKDEIALITQQIVREYELTGKTDINKVYLINVKIKSWIERIIKDVNSQQENSPDIGLLPRYIWVERRFKDIRDAIMRYANKMRPIPIEWIEEYESLRKEIEERNANNLVTQ
ncbi:hypothetical protein [Cyclobacterium salsum]|uniref:hypothetical protein n=1 Tax=Cyclobacterium salsum TaxID=2666329 RepID=UPI0013914185|nr:hypothetical protein [Cyclobacterium salsum]